VLPDLGPDGVYVTGITLSQNSLTLIAGDTATITAAVTPAGATNPLLNWVSSNPAVATVSGGLVTAIGAGMATITASAIYGASDTVKASCAVAVTAEGGQKILVITGITQAYMEQTYGGGIIALFPAGTSDNNAMTELRKYFAGSAALEKAVAGNGFDNIEPPVQTGETYTVTVPLFTSAEKAYTGTGTFDIYCAVTDKAKRYFYKFVNVSVTSPVTNVSMPDMIFIREEDDGILKMHGIITLTNIPSNPVPKHIWVNFQTKTAAGGFSWWNGSKGENDVNFKSGSVNLPWVAYVRNFERLSGSGDFFPADLTRFWVYVQYDGGDNDPRNYAVETNVSKHFDSLEEAMAATINLGTVDLTKPPPNELFSIWTSSDTNGIWINSGDKEVLDLTGFYDDTGMRIAGITVKQQIDNPWEEGFYNAAVTKGTYAVSGSNIMFTITHVSSSIYQSIFESIFGAQSEENYDQWLVIWKSFSGWSTQRESKTSVINAMMELKNWSPEEAEEWYDETCSDLLGALFEPFTGTYALSGNNEILTLTVNGITKNYTR
jgi:hypothetical protein